MLSSRISANPALPTLRRLWARTLSTACVCQLPVGGAVRRPQGKETTYFASSFTHFITFVSHSSSSPSPRQLNSVRSFTALTRIGLFTYFFFFFGGVSCDQGSTREPVPRPGIKPKADALEGRSQLLTARDVPVFTHLKLITASAPLRDLGPRSTGLFQAETPAPAHH